MALAQVTTLGDCPAAPGSLIAAVRDVLVSVLQVPSADPTVWHRSLPTDRSIVAARHRECLVLVEVTMFSGRRPATISDLHDQISRRVSETGVDVGSILCVVAESPPASWSIGGIPQDQVDVGFDINI